MHQAIGSTNTWSLEQCAAGKQAPFACFAESQTQGKGRRGKRWLMAPGSNIALSLCWPFTMSYRSLQLLPLSIAMAVVKTLEAFQLQEVQVKWPNDVYVNGKKIAGILLETRPLKAGTAGENAEDQIAVVIGVGLNYDMGDMRELLKGQLEAQGRQGAESALPELTDVLGELNSDQSRDENSQNVTRRDITAQLLIQVISACQRFQQDTSCFMQEFRSHYDYCLHKDVIVNLDNGDEVFGRALGIDENAELIVDVAGKRCAFNSADVSVKAHSDG